MLMSSENEFLRNLYEQLDSAWNQSKISQNPKAARWNYALMGSPIRCGGALMVGFNWGARKGHTYEKQTSIPLKSDDWGSLKRVLPLIEQYFNIGERDLMQTNFCFFRSEKQKDIPEQDIVSCASIFLELIDFIRPKLMICFSTVLRNWLIDHAKVMVGVQRESVVSKRGNLVVLVGKLRGKSGSYPIVFLPHPNYPLERQARRLTWEAAVKLLNDFNSR